MTAWKPVVYGSTVFTFADGTEVIHDIGDGGRGTLHRLRIIGRGVLLQGTWMPARHSCQLDGGDRPDGSPKQYQGLICEAEVLVYELTLGKKKEDQ